MGAKRKPADLRFWEKVAVGSHSECWPWLNASTEHGYGVLRVNDRNVKASRLAWILTNGPILDGLCVLHKCDNPPCCNPDHLFVGTMADNVADMFSKGRQQDYRNVPSGDRHPARLHPERMCRGDRHPAKIRPGMILRGTATVQAKLSEDIVRECRMAYKRGESSVCDLAKMYGVSSTAMFNAVFGKTWKHVDTPPATKANIDVIPRGSKRHCAILNEDLVAACRLAYKKYGASIKHLAERWRVNPITMQQAVSGRLWKHVA